MDDKIIQRIDGAIKSIDRIRLVVNGVSFEQFIKSDTLMDIVSFNIIQLGERMIKIEQLLKDKYPNIPWSKAKTMRNIIVHDYESANPFIIYKTAT